MEGFELFPKIKGAIKWMAEHSDSVIHFGWNVVAAIILLFIGKLIARLLSRGLEKLLLRRQVDATIVHFFSALVRYITIAFTAVAALGRVRYRNLLNYCRYRRGGFSHWPGAARVTFQLCRRRTACLPASFPRRGNCTNWPGYRHSRKGPYFLHHSAHCG
ncbi:mechanosensitive channel MscS [Salmonella enterica subsp. enterica]|uniref:Small-conductance mechanosensitive channel n=1 Tax=Salmonella enterica I TaxID=59201 RepID=A0A3S4K426_SALET|nr:mechanosensitive channel MscS [Salmonella enterica subsp. enterica]